MKILLLISSLLLMFMTTSCAMLKPIPASLTISINTASDLNPDADGRASPIVFRIYQLTDSKKFNEKDFFDIFEDDKEHLADSLIKSDEMELSPNESQTQVLKLDKKTRHIGFLAAYRDIDNATWREIKAVTPNTLAGIPVYGKQHFTVNLNKNKIVATE